MSIPEDPPRLTCRFVPTVAEVEREAWDRLVQPDDSPFNEWSFLAAVEEAKGAAEPRLLELIAEHRLAREHLPTTALSSAAVWGALLEAPMPYAAMLGTWPR